MDAIDALIGTMITKPTGIATGEAPVWNGTSWVRSSVTRLGQSSLASGAASIATFLRGDGSWQPGGANMLWDSVDAGVTLPVSTITTPSLDQSFKHLLVAYKAKSNYGGTGDTMMLRFNGLSTAAYYNEGLSAAAATGTFSESLATTALKLGSIGINALANAPGSGFALIPWYAGSTLYMGPVIAMGGGAFNTTTGQIHVDLNFGFYAASGPINTLTFFSNNSGGFLTGTRITVYGI